MRRLPEIARRRWVYYLNKWYKDRTSKGRSTNIGGGW